MNEPAPSASPPSGARIALAVGLLGLLVGAGTAGYVASMALRPAPLAHMQPQQGQEIADLQKRFDALAQTFADLQTQPPAPAVPDDVAKRLDALETQIMALDTMVRAQDDKVQGATAEAQRLPLALALIRVEERFERGQNFVNALTLLQKVLPAPLNEPDAAALAAAAPGVPPPPELIIRLDRAERGLRRDARLAVTSSPLERIWAELQSLVLVRSEAVARGDTVGQALTAVKAAIARDNAQEFAAAWAQLPSASQKSLAEWHGDVQRRLAAHSVLERLMAEQLALPIHPADKN